MWSVGLLQREIEAGGFTTIILSNNPELTASVSVPRIAAIEHPYSRTVGQPGDIAGQMAVLRAMLKSLVEIHFPGEVVHMPFEWQERLEFVNKPLPEPPPISTYLRKHIFQIPRLIKRDIPTTQE
jgi:hypothetical protein